MAKSQAGAEEQIRNLVTRNVQDVIERGHLLQALQGGKKLRVKFGIDPTGSELHLGHAVVLWKLREFQDLGHKAVLIIGDFTARVGDPSGRAEARPPLSEKEIKANLKTYLKQAGKILDIGKAEVHYNSKWLAKLDLRDIAELLSAATAAQILKREDFARRLETDADITMLETFYPLLQGYDSVAIRADVELGGHDQLLNLLMGRKVQRHYKMPEQDVITVPLLVGLDGEKKMSKSANNYIALTSPPEDMFGKVMSMRDEMIIPYFRAATDAPETEIARVEKEIKQGANPKSAKVELARSIVARYHGNAAADKAAEKWDIQFSKKGIPADIQVVFLDAKPMTMKNIVSGAMSTSGTQAHLLIQQGAVEYNQQRETDPNEVKTPKDGDIIRAGRKIVRVRIK